MVELTTSRVDKGKFIAPKATAKRRVVKEPTTVIAPVVEEIPVKPVESIIPKRPLTPEPEPTLQDTSDVVSRTSEKEELSMKELIRMKFTQGKISSYEEARRLANKERKKGDDASMTTIKVDKPDPVEQPSTSGPKLTIVDGQIRIDEASLFVSTTPVEQQFEDVQRIDEESNRFITSASFGKKKARKVCWNSQMTQRFYDGLSYFGTNFQLIALMFPGLSRAQIKLKFTYEETHRGALITKALLNKKPIPPSLKERILDITHVKS